MTELSFFSVPLIFRFRGLLSLLTMISALAPPLNKMTSHNLFSEKAQKFFVAVTISLSLYLTFLTTKSVLDR